MPSEQEIADLFEKEFKPRGLGITDDEVGRNLRFFFVSIVIVGGFFVNYFNLI
jgi:hypothetical protein